MKTSMANFFYLCVLYIKDFVENLPVPKFKGIYCYVSPRLNVVVYGKPPPHGPKIYKDTKPLMSAFLKNLPVKVLGGRCLSV